MKLRELKDFLVKYDLHLTRREIEEKGDTKIQKVFVSLINNRLPEARAYLDNGENVTFLPF